MKQVFSKIYVAIVIIFIVVVGFVLTAPDDLFQPRPNLRHKRIINLWERILLKDTLVAITHNNSTGYFIYKGRPLGVHYDMLNDFCRQHGLHLKIIVEDDLEKALRMLKRNHADLLAVDLTYTAARKKHINFTHAHAYNHQVLVQRRHTPNEKARHVEAVLDLQGQKVYIQKGTVFKNQLLHLQQETGTDFTIVEDPRHTMEELIQMVAEGKIDYTACDERVAKANKTYLPNLDISLKISAKQKLCWAVPPYADTLKSFINRWLDNYKKSRRYLLLQQKYFTSKRAKHLVDDKNLPGKGGQLSPYDELIKKGAKKLHWDWRLLASLIYQESRFNPQTRSWAGAVGLMQLMPETAKKMGTDNLLDPAQNIAAGVRYLQWLDKNISRWHVSDDEKIKFVLAAYNVGLGHVLDARRLATKNKKDARRWSHSVDTFIVLKSKPRYYRDPVVQYGYCHGQETYDFVQEVIRRYEDYKNLVPQA